MEPESASEEMLSAQVVAMLAQTAPSLLYDYYNPDASITLKPSFLEVRQGSGETR